MLLDDEKRIHRLQPGVWLMDAWYAINEGDNLRALDSIQRGARLRYVNDYQMVQFRQLAERVLGKEG